MAGHGWCWLVDEQVDPGWTRVLFLANIVFVLFASLS